MSEFPGVTTARESVCRTVIVACFHRCLLVEHEKKAGIPIHKCATCGEDYIFAEETIPEILKLLHFLSDFTSKHKHNPLSGDMMAPLHGE